MTNLTKVIMAICIFAIASITAFNAFATPVHTDYVLSFSQAEHMIEREQSERDDWSNEGFYCGTPINFDIKNIKQEDFEARSKAGLDVIGLTQMNPINLGLDPRKIDKDDGLEMQIFRSWRKELEHMLPISYVAKHLPIWKLGRKEAEKQSIAVKFWIGYPHNLTFIYGFINSHRSAKLFADTLDAPTYGTCGVRISKGGDGLFSPADNETRGAIARSVLGFYKFFEEGVLENDELVYPNPLPKEQYILLLKWHEQYPITKQERKIHDYIVRAWQKKAETKGKRIARALCDGTPNEKQCLKLEYVFQSRRVSEQDFRNPMFINE